MTGGQLAVNAAQKDANRAVFSNPRVSDDTATRANMIERGGNVTKVRAMTPQAVKNWAGPSYKKGGEVKKTGLALVHKGEKVIPARANVKVDPKGNVVRQGGRPKNRRGSSDGSMVGNGC